MAHLIWYLTVGGCALLFFSIGVHAQRKKTPMHFWSGGPEIKPEEITDVPAYNRANGRMWKGYSLSYLLSCAAWPFHEGVAIVILFVASTVGLIPLIMIYKRIEQKYRVKP